MNASADLRDVDIRSVDFKRDPYPFYARLRDKAPVFRTRIGRRSVWLITRYADVVAALRDPRLAKDRRAVGARGFVSLPGGIRIVDAMERNMLNVDGADHARLRALVQHAFTPRMIEALRGRIQSTTDGLLDTLEKSIGPVDLIAGLTLPLPLTIICEMLGIPEADRERFHHWVQHSLGVTSAEAGIMGIARGLVSIVGQMRYLRGQIRRKRAEPGDDMLSALVKAEEAGDRLSEDELVAMVGLLLIAGHETSVNLIGNGALAFLQHPQQFALLRSDPTLAKSAVEEVARYCSPVETATERYASEDIEIAGTLVPRGEMVLAVLAAANRDPAQFPNPDDFDICRNPNAHAGFGMGAHYCVGAVLARMEAQIALTSLVTRYPDMRLAVKPEELQWRSMLVMRGMKRLPVHLGCSR